MSMIEIIYPEQKPSIRKKENKETKRNLLKDYVKRINQPGNMKQSLMNGKKK